jgi:uncharacterized protein (DUF58 family)
VVQSALRNGDRAGIVGLGGRRPRWLGADIGRRQFYRVLDVALGIGSEYQSTTSTGAAGRGPARRGGGGVLDHAGHRVRAGVDRPVQTRSHRGGCGHPGGWPFDGGTEPILERMWALQRSAMYRDMSVIGVDVVSWPGDITLDQAMHLVPDHGRRSVRRRP